MWPASGVSKGIRMVPEPAREGEVREYDRPVEHPEQWFSDSEYRDRVERTKRKMRERDLDVLVVSDPANHNYLTGYRGWTFYTAQAAIVALDKEQPISVNREMDTSSAKKTTWMDNENVRHFSDEYVENKDPYLFIAKLIEDSGWDDDRVGVEMDGYYYSANNHLSMEPALPDAEVTNASYLVNRVRMRKSDQEVEYIRQAQRITDNAHRAIRDSLGAGIRESDVAADVWHALIRGTDEYGGDYPSIAPLFGSRHLTWSDRPYDDDTTVSVEMSGARRRYHAPMSRTFHIGSPSDEVRTRHEQLVHGLEVLLDAVEPGITCAEVSQRYREGVDYAPKASRQGYSLGLSYPPTWLEMSANIRPEDDTVLEPNMVFHPILGADFGEYQLSEAFLVTENGAETFTEFPRELIVV